MTYNNTFKLEVARDLEQVAQGPIQLGFGISQGKDMHYHQMTVFFFLQKKYKYQQITSKHKIFTGVYQENLYCTFIIINVYKYWLVLTKGTKWHHVFMWMKGNITKWRCEGEFRIYGHLISYKSEICLLIPWKHIWYSKITVGESLYYYSAVTATVNKYSSVHFLIAK